MQEVLDKLVESRIINLLETININYSDKFKNSDIEKELIYIKKHINWKMQKLINDDTESNISLEIKTKTKTKTKNIIQLKTKKNVNNIKVNENQCSGRKWSDYIFNKTTNKQLNDIEDKFKVDDFNDLDIKEFNSKYIIGLRCCKNKIDKSKYCNLHTKHLIHGDYLKLPDKELCYHFMKDGKYL